MIIKSAHNRPRDHKAKTFKNFNEEGETLFGLTKQAFKEECDINAIIKKHDGGRGILTHVNRAQALYGDFTLHTNEYQDAVQLVQTQNDNFMKIDSSIRGRFDNDAGKFVEFVGNPANTEECIKLGLKIAEPAPTPEVIQKVEIINPTPTNDE